jgi:hypothetical protein
MAQEIKNTFLKSKMNKDLDDRILPNGEYRDARNISVGRSEDNDVGALENVIGNNLMVTTNLNIPELEIIGIKESPSNDTLFVFLTDYTDTNPSSPTNAPSNTNHFIYAFNTITEEYTKLVSGSFLNFSKTNRIIGINLIENLLFWTDNRNQPRKININSSLISTRTSLNEEGDYYTDEHQISVAKYNPYEAIKLYNRIEVEINGFDVALAWVTMLGDSVDELTPYIGAAVVSQEIASLFGNDYVFVAAVALDGVNTKISFNKALDVAPDIGDSITIIQSTMTNEDDNAAWPGDPNYLEDRFVRFSYRFKHDDNEYSLMAPFTQIAYIPKQKGYFINGDEEAAYRSTIVEFMENNVQNIGLVIPLPDAANRVSGSYKIKEVEILFRESGNLAVKVLETLTIGEIAAASSSDNSYTYEYQSRKPYRTLPEAQTVRVYDKVPVTAFSQETAGNRIIYGNFKDRYTPPANLDYNCRISHKNSSGLFNNFIEYPNHSVKRNRNYQVGFILADKFGRQSPVILSSVNAGINTGGDFFFGSTIYSAYDSISSQTNMVDWFGDAIKLVLNSPIQSDINNVLGTPGLYAIPQKNQSTGDGFAIGSTGVGSGVGISGSVWTFIYTGGTYPLSQNIPEVGQYLRGQFIDFVQVLSITGPTFNMYTVTTDGQVSSSYLPTISQPSGVPDLRFAYNINDLGWYSYKIVVKQTEQEYYNVYLPGILNGYPGQALQANSNIIGDGKVEGAFPNDELGVTAHTVLFNDNINKIPRDLAEVGPTQKQFRSSVILYGRVSNIMNTTPTVNSDPSPSNIQYYPRINNSKNAVSHLATSIAAASDLEMSFKQLSGSGVYTATETWTTDLDQAVFPFTTITALQLANSEITVTIGGVDTFAYWSVAGQALVFEDNHKPTQGTLVTATVTSNVGLAGGIDGDKTFYQIDSNPLIARISTKEKSIGWGAELLINPDGADPTWEWNMQPALAIYETEAVESLLDIYWESTSEGLIADINSQLLTGYEGITSFQGLSWIFNEGNEPEDPITSWFEPYNAQGVFINNTTAALTSVTNGYGQTITNFDLVVGDTAPNIGKYQIRLSNPANNGFTFTELSNERDVFYFAIQSTTSGGIIDTNYIGGIPGGDGALKNIEPFVANGILPVSRLIEDTVILPASAWVTAGLENGTSRSSSNMADFVYTMTSAPAHWDINAEGEISQESGTTSAGIYTITIIATDANNNAGPAGTDYGPKSYSQELIVTFGEDPINPDLVPTYCLTTASATTTPVPQFPVLIQADSIIPVNSSAVLYGYSTGIWYISATSDLGVNSFKKADGTDIWTQGLNNNPLINPNTLPEEWIFRLGTGAHTAGTLAMNMTVQGRTNGFGLGFTALANVNGRMKLFTRRTGETTWTDASESGIPEYNNVDNNPVTRVTGSGGTTNATADWPGTLNSDAQTNPWSVPTNRTEGWANFIRCYNFNEVVSATNDSSGIEYAWVIEGLSSQLIMNAPEETKTVAWLTIDDLHNPTCVPWQGVNAVANNLNAPAFAYERSVETSSRDYTITGTPTDILWAKTPYIDYAKRFYENSNLEVVWKPQEATPFLNYNLELGVLAFNPPLQAQQYDSPNNGLFELQLVGQFNYENGEMLSNSVAFQNDSTLVGNKAVPTDNFVYKTPLGNQDDTINGSRNRGISRLVIRSQN